MKRHGKFNVMFEKILQEFEEFETTLQEFEEFENIFQ